MADILSCLAEQALIAGLAGAIEDAAESATNQSQAGQAATPGDAGGANEASISVYGSIFFGAAARCLIADARDELEDWLDEQADIHLQKAEEYHAAWKVACECANSVAQYSDVSYDNGGTCVDSLAAIAFASTKRHLSQEFERAQLARSRYQTGLVSGQIRDMAMTSVAAAVRTVTAQYAAECAIDAGYDRANATRCHLFMQGAVAPNIRSGFSYAQDFQGVADNILATFETGAQGLFAYGLDAYRESRQDNNTAYQSLPRVHGQTLPNVPGATSATGPNPHGESSPFDFVLS